MSSASRRLFSFSSRLPARPARRSARHVDAHIFVRFWFRRRSASAPKIRRPPSYDLRTTKPRGMCKNSGKFRADRFATGRTPLFCEHFSSISCRCAVDVRRYRPTSLSTKIASSAGPLPDHPQPRSLGRSCRAHRDINSACRWHVGQMAPRPLAA